VGCGETVGAWELVGAGEGASDGAGDGWCEVDGACEMDGAGEGAPDGCGDGAAEIVGACDTVGDTVGGSVGALVGVVAVSVRWIRHKVRITSSKKFTTNRGPMRVARPRQCRCSRAKGAGF